MFRLQVAGVLVAMAVSAAGSAASTGAVSSRLRVKQVIAKGTPLPVEGSIPYVRVVRSDGSRVARRRLAGAVTASATLSIRPGRYRLLSWQRYCDGNCGYLDPPTDRCSRAFRINARQQLKATITVRYGSGCRIVFGPAKRLAPGPVG